MELAAEHAERHQQVATLHEHLPSLYAQLLSKYETQKIEIVEYKHKAHYWEAQFSQIKAREKLLNAEIDELKAKLRKREQQLFGNKSEKKSNNPDQTSESQSQGKTKKKRGQQRGSKGHGKRDYSHLPVVEETVSLSPKELSCPSCKLSYEELVDSEGSEILEIINVRAYRRKIRRKKYKRHCVCEENPAPQIITPPPMDRLLPKSKLGISIWGLLLLNKYKYQQPIYRILQQLNGYGLSLAMGTVIDGLQKLLPLFIPLYDAIVEKSLAAKHWHADETGWKVFEEIEGKKNHRWYLWIFHNSETVVYKIDASRSSKVLIEHFGKEHEGGILNVDRYVAYKVIAKAGLFILAFCWAHVRRDFLNYSKAYEMNESWGLAWVARIGNLYHINNQRIQHEQISELFQKHDKELQDTILQMKEALVEEISDPNILPSAKKLLKSLNRHWEGLTVFVTHPEIPMDNNQAERGLRPPIVGRKGYYGSGSVWSAELAAALFTILGTLEIWKLNAHTWLLAYLQECAILGGKAPIEIDKYLPWNMTEKQKELFSQPPLFEDSG